MLKKKENKLPIIGKQNGISNNQIVFNFDVDKFRRTLQENIKNNSLYESRSMELADNFRTNN